MNKLRKEAPNPIALGGLVIANVITPLGLDSEDQDFVDGEIKWLFAAADNLLQVNQKVQQRLAEETTRLKEKLRTELPGPYKDMLRKKGLEEGLAKITPQIWQEEIKQSQPIAVPIPPSAEQKPQITNQLLDTADIFWLGMWPGRIESGLNLIGRHLDSLQGHLNQEALMGEAAKGNIALQNQIKLARQGVVRVLQEMGQTINDAYGVQITCPDQLVEFLT